MATKKFNPLTPPFDLTANSVNDLTDHTKATHDALNINADTVDNHHITVGPIQPPLPTVGDLWVDTT